MTNTSTALRVAIIGAGLGGLCLAQGLRRRGIVAQVYERDATADARRQGYRLRIDQTGQAALAACLPAELYARWRQSCAPFAGAVRTLDTELAPLPEKWVDDWRDGDAAPDLRADRQRMRELLMVGLAPQLHFGKTLVDYEEMADGTVAVCFGDGTRAVVDLLVAADGIHSAVAARRFPGARPRETGALCCYGKTLLDPAARAALAAPLQSGTTVIFDTALALVVDAMLFDAPDSPADYVYWALIGQRERFGVAGDATRWSGLDARACVARLAQAWPAPLRALFALAAPGAETLVAVREAPAIAPWPATRVAALGDAIHAMSPASGLGANSALYDAAALVQALDSEADLLDAVARYETAMRAHSFGAVQSSRRGGSQLFAAPSGEC